MERDERKRTERTFGKEDGGRCGQLASATRVGYGMGIVVHQATAERHSPGKETRQGHVMRIFSLLETRRYNAFDCSLISLALMGTQEQTTGPGRGFIVVPWAATCFQKVRLAQSTEEKKKQTIFIFTVSLLGSAVVVTSA